MRGSRLAGRRILVVEDSRFLRVGILRALRGEGAHAEDVESGERAVEVVAAGGSFEVMLVDLALPGMDGAECAHLVRVMRRIVRGGNVDVIVGMSGDRNRLVAQRDGFDSTLAKPFSGDELIEVLVRAGGSR